MTYIMIIFAHVGMMGSGNSNSVSVANFKTKESCETARPQVESLSSGSTKIVKTICVAKY